MDITDVKFFPYNKGGNFKGYATVELEESLVIRSIRLMDGEKGFFIGFPSQQDKDGEYHDVVFPITKELREKITAEVIEAYEAESKLRKKSKR